MSSSGRSLFDARRSGVLLHPTSLPGPHGCGDLGDAAHHFVDWLVSAGQSLWQMLPLNPVGPGNSPYQSVSTFAGNPLLVDLPSLVERGWLGSVPDADFERKRCDYGRAAPWRMALLRKAWQGFGEHAHDGDREQLHEFCRRQSHWLGDYALFMTLDERYGTPWNRWPAQFAWRDEAALARLREDAAEEIGFWCFVQWQFMQQWQRVRSHAHARGVRIVGDAPIFVAHHSADVWANTAQYLLDAQGEPTVVAGVPPDYFSATGQRWGNPLYDWTAMHSDGYAWWKRRLAHLFECFDAIRLDHFRGFEGYWEVPAHEEHAVNGQWRPGPGRAFFDSLHAASGPLPLIAEDLGVITPPVTELRLACGFPGMRVLQFAFADTPANPYLPHNYAQRTVAYTGTHDNDTTLGWWQRLGAHEREAVRRYLGPDADREIHWAMMRALSQSVANTVVYPLQDVLGLDGTHRMNVPGRAQDCWEWRFEWNDIGDAPAAQLAAMTHAHGRSPQPF
ncbi:MAG TPA: 4-alpha-glucanotransferase [Ramlibacter sp.]|nr:4-alpha-glucanotransferase [Ramlibacter sp.]